MTYDSKFDHWPTAVQATWPAKNAKVITPSNTLDITDAAGDNFPMYTKGVQIGNTAGNLVVIMAGNKADDTTTVTFPVAANQVYPYQIRRVLTSSTATTIIGLFD